MARKLFCEWSPFTYWLSTEKEILKRKVSDVVRKFNFAKRRTEAPLPVVVYRHNSLIRRRPAYSALSYGSRIGRSSPISISAARRLIK